MLAHSLESFPGETPNWLQYTEGMKEAKKEADHSRLVGGSFSK